MIFKQIDKNTGELRFYGDISQWWISAIDFTDTIEKMDALFSTIIIRTHCYGGEVFEGTVIFNAITRCKAKVIVEIDGVSASMMGIVMQAADEVIAADNAYVMVHCPTAGAGGTAKDLQATAKLLLGMEKNFAKAYARKNGKTEKEGYKWFDGVDHWFTAEEALAEGLITSIKKPVIKGVPKLDKPTKSGEVESIFSRYAALLDDKSIIPIAQNLETENSTMKKELIAKYNLQGVTEASTDAEIMAALEVHFNKTESDFKAKQKAVITALVTSSETASGKEFPEAQKNTLISFGEQMGIEALQNMLGVTASATVTVAGNPQNAAVGTTPAIPQVVSMMTPGNSSSNVDARASMSWDELQEKHPDYIEYLEKNDKLTFNAKYKAKYGNEPE